MNLTLATAAAGAGAPGERMDTEGMRAEALGLALPGDIAFWNAVAAAADLVDSRPQGSGNERQDRQQRGGDVSSAAIRGAQNIR